MEVVNKMLRKFQSIQNAAEFGYSYDSEAWTAQAPINARFRMYKTYGDGLTQHSGDWAVTSEYFADYMVSLTQAMLGDSELAKELHYLLVRSPRDEAIAFAASIEFKPAEGCTMYEKKPRYFSISEKKVTSSDSKQYDKRYSKVESFHDGSPSAIYAMILPDCADGLERYQWATAIYHWTMDNERQGRYMQLPAVFLQWTDDSDKAREMRDAFEAAWNVVESYRLRSAAETSVSQFERRASKSSTEVAA